MLLFLIVNCSLNTLTRKYLKNNGRIHDIHCFVTALQKNYNSKSFSFLKIKLKIALKNNLMQEHKLKDTTLKC